ncbi:hypothetical protein ACFLRY_03575 [Bacteroidota bacterium]
MKKRYWVLVIYIFIVILFYIMVFPITELIFSNDIKESGSAFTQIINSMDQISNVVYVFYGFVILITAISILCYFIFRRKKKTELEKGFGIISIISMLLILFLIL